MLPFPYELFRALKASQVEGFILNVHACSALCVVVHKSIGLNLDEWQRPAAFAASATEDAFAVNALENIHSVLH